MQIVLSMHVYINTGMFYNNVRRGSRTTYMQHAPIKWCVTLITILMISLVSVLWTFVLVNVKAKRCWTSVLLIEPPYPTWIVDRVACAPLL